MTAPQPPPLPQPQSLLPHRRGGGAFSRAETRKRVAAQLDTLIEQGVRHVVLSAFGCGAFRNPADEVAAVYRLTQTLNPNPNPNPKPKPEPEPQPEPQPEP